MNEIKKPENPYPEDIFPEPSMEQYALFNKKLKEVGLSPDAYNGTMGRMVWKNCCEEYEKSLPSEEEITEILLRLSNILSDKRNLTYPKVIYFLRNKAKAISKRIRGEG